MRIFWSLFSATFAATIATLVGIIFQEQIAASFNSNRLVADIYAAPWSPLFPESDTREDLEALWIAQGLNGYEIERILEGNLLGFAQIRVRNPGSKKVEKIKLSMGDYPPDRVVILEQNLPPRLASDSRAVELAPNLGPAGLVNSGFI